MARQGGVGLLRLAQVSMRSRQRNLYTSSILLYSHLTFSYLPNNFHPTGIAVSQKQAYVGMSVVSVVVLFYLLSHIFWWTMFTSGFLVGTHAALRDASMHKDEEDKVAMSGDLSLEEEQSAFLGDEV